MLNSSLGMNFELDCVMMGYIFLYGRNLRPQVFLLLCTISLYNPHKQGLLVIFFSDSVILGFRVAWFPKMDFFLLLSMLSSFQFLLVSFPSLYFKAGRQRSASSVALGATFSPDACSALACVDQVLLFFLCREGNFRAQKTT